MEKNEILVHSNVREETRNSNIIALYFLFKFVANGLFKLSAFVLLLVLLYEAKSDLGIDIFPGWSPFH